MLKSSGDSRGFIAKVCVEESRSVMSCPFPPTTPSHHTFPPQVADFGLSVKMDHIQTHLSNVYQVGRGGGGGGGGINQYPG